MKIYTTYGWRQINSWDHLTPAELAKLCDEVIAEMGGAEAVDELIRREKATIIEDIFRGAKLAQCHDHRFVQELRNPAGFFDKLYELDLDTLDAYSKALDKKNTQYMKDRVNAHNRGENGHINDCGWY